MPYNGAGIFTLTTGNPVVTGTVISSSWANNTLTDIANNGLSNCITKDGQTTPTANLPMGGFRHLGVMDGVTSDNYATINQLQAGGTNNLSAVSGADTITAVSVPPITSYVAGQTFRFVAAGTNSTNAVTLNISSLGAKAVTKLGTAPLNAGDIRSGAVIEVMYDGTQFQVIGGLVRGDGYGCVGLLGRNVTGALTSQMTFSAASVTLRNPTNGDTVGLTNTASIICNVSLAGPAINCRDQAGAFSANSWIHFYFIWNGQTLATISSAQAPSTGPTLPTGYTHWAYIGAVRYSSISELFNVAINGRWVWYIVGQTSLSGGGATSSTAVSVSTLIPPNAVNFIVEITQFGGQTNGAGTMNIAHFLGWSNNQIFSQTNITVTAAASSVFIVPGPCVTLPNLSQTYYYWNAVGAGSAPAGNHLLLGYEMAI